MTDAKAIAAEFEAYLVAATNEWQVCPHCETWLLSECSDGKGCPTPDGMNGATRMDQ